MLYLKCSSSWSCVQQHFKYFLSLWGVEVRTSAFFGWEHTLSVVSTTWVPKSLGSKCDSGNQREKAGGIPPHHIAAQASRESVTDRKCYTQVLLKMGCNPSPGVPQTSVRFSKDEDWRICWLAELSGCPASWFSQGMYGAQCTHSSWKYLVL